MKPLTAGYSTKSGGIASGERVLPDSKTPALRTGLVDDSIPRANEPLRSDLAVDELRPNRQLGVVELCAVHDRRGAEAANQAGQRDDVDLVDQTRAKEGGVQGATRVGDHRPGAQDRGEPQVSVIEQPSEELGSWAGQLLATRAKGGAMLHARITLDPVLRARTSTLGTAHAEKRTYDTRH